MRYRSVVLGAVLCFVSCAHKKSEYELRQDAQRAQLRRAAPAELDEGDGSDWRAYKTLRARFYYDPAFAQLEGNVQHHLEERVRSVNDVLQGALHARIEIESVRQLPENIPSETDLELALTKLNEQDDGGDVDVVIGLIGALPRASFSFFDLGRAQLLGKHIVLRSMSSPDEIRQLDTYDTIDPQERSRVYQQRKRHKEATVMLHEIGHSLGALHVRDPASIMHASYESSAQAFAPHNLELMELALAERLRPSEEQDLRALATAIKLRLQAAAWEGFVDQERTEHLARLEAFITAADNAAKASAVAQAQVAASHRDTSGLSEADRKVLAELDDKRDQGERAAVYKGLRALAQKYPDTYFLQHETCDLGMKLRRSFNEIRPYCDRVAAAALASP